MVTFQRASTYVVEIVVRQKQYIGLDGLRFLAAALVTFYHLGFCSWANPTSSARFFAMDLSSLHWTAPALSVGWVGVQIFFVISGFVISLSAEGASAFSFVRSRALRLAPGAWICSSISLLVLIAFGHSFSSLIWPFLSSISFWPFQPWLSGVYWTLGVEIAFYTILSIMIFCGKGAHIRALAIALTVISGTLWGAYLLSPTPPNWAKFLAESRIGALTLAQHGCFFSIGIFISILTKKPKDFTSLSFAVITTPICLAQINFTAKITSSYMNQYISPNISMLTWIVSMAIFIASIRFNDKIHNVPDQAKSTFRNMGRATYPLYLLHEIAGTAAMAALMLMGTSAVAALAGAVTLMIALSVIEDMMERPISNLIRKWFTPIENWAKVHAPTLLMKSV